jgi:hypothetical protein
MIKRILFIICILVFSNIYSQNNSFVRYINWNKSIATSNGYLKMSFSNAFYPDTSNNFPYYREQIEMPFYCDMVLSDVVFEKLDANSLSKVLHLSNLPDTFVFKKYSGVSRKMNIINYSLLPVWRSKNSNEVYRITSFSINIPNTSIKKVLKKASITAQHSVLSNGKWYKIKLKDDGIYKITYAQLKNMGFSNPGNVRIYGNGGGMLPKKVTGERAADLVEDAVQYDDANGFILFYGQSPNLWNYNAVAKHFYHSKHKFSDYSYYFLTDYFGKGEQVSSSTEPQNTNIDVTSFDDYDFHEADEVNLIRSGSEWYGDQLDVYNPMSFNFNFPNIVNSSKIYFYYSIIGISTTPYSYFLFGISGNNYKSAYINLTNPNYFDGDFAQPASGNFNFSETADNIPVNVSYINSGDLGATGYIDYFGFNVRRNLTFTGDQMQFRDINSVGTGNVARFIVNNASQNLAVWDVTNVCLPQSMNAALTNTTITFSASVDSLRQFIIFKTNSGFLNPIINGDDVGVVENQDIHGATNPDLIIVAPQDDSILKQAQILADFRTKNDGYKVFLTTTDKIYNEFSSGKRDISAIRDMAKMFYERSTGENDMPKYLLLFGDGTYDNKTKNENNNNLIPTYQSPNSLNKTYSYVSDDFYGWLDDADTLSDEENLLDISIGRLPIKNGDEATAVVKKIINYASTSTMADWRNILCFIADDGDIPVYPNLHIGQADPLADAISEKYPSRVIQKIYLDAYNFITTSVGQTAPDVNAAINNRVNKGALIVNYTGHGGETLLSHHAVVTTASVLSWKNFDKLPLFITATCEFGRFDDLNIIIPSKQFATNTTAGEQVLLNPNGGGIGLFTAARLANAPDNIELNTYIFDTIFTKDRNGNYLRLGDVLRIAKNMEQGNPNRLIFAMLGDPSTLLAFPKGNGIKTDSINGIPVNTLNDTLLADTLHALSFARISGHIEDDNGNLQNGFKGYIYPTIYDKAEIRTTLGNSGNVPYKYSASENILYKGFSSVSEGRFSFQFQVPKDIKYNFNNGKIVYYANDSISDMAGYTNKFIVGGIDSKANIDTVGPEIDLYMNNSNFIPGGITDPNPQLLVKLHDQNGVNMTGVGIGHDLTAIIDSDYSHLVNLDEFYQTELNDYTSGSALYPLYNLVPGEHVIKVIAWDVYNNSSEKEITFRVIQSNNLVISHVINYPNPFTNFTNFVFEHNWSDEAINIEIKIFSFSGQIVTILNYRDLSMGYRTIPLQWNGTNSSGSRVKPGIYLYKILVTTKSGKHAESYGKMVFALSK